MKSRGWPMLPVIIGKLFTLMKLFRTGFILVEAYRVPSLDGHDKTDGWPGLGFLPLDGYDQPGLGRFCDFFLGAVRRGLVTAFAIFHT